MQDMLTQAMDLALVGGLGDTVAAGNDRLEQYHPGRAAQLAYSPEGHGVAAAYHEKRCQALRANNPKSNAADDHEIAAGIHRVAAQSGTDGDTLCARRMSAQAILSEIEENQYVGASSLVEVETCGDYPGHPFRGNGSAPGEGSSGAESHSSKLNVLSNAAHEATRHAYDSKNPEQHEHAANVHEEAARHAAKSLSTQADRTMHARQAVEHRMEASRLRRLS